MASVSELEAEVAATRDRLSATIDRIQDKLTVSGMVDEIMGQAGLPAAQTASHDIVLGLLRRHPVPVMIAAAGLGFLIYRMNQKSVGFPARALPDDDGVADVPILNDGRVRAYDPDLPSRHMATLSGEPRQIDA